MRTSSVARQFVRCLAAATLGVVGLLLLASAAPVCAEPVRVPSVDWLSLSRDASPASRNGFLVPMLATAATDAGARLTVAENAIRGTAPTRLSSAAGQDQTPPKRQRSCFGRNWKWFVPVMAGVAFGIACAVGCFPAGG